MRIICRELGVIAQRCRYHSNLFSEEVHIVLEEMGGQNEWTAVATDDPGLGEA
jgi:hypothetical protein